MARRKKKAEEGTHEVEETVSETEIPEPVSTDEEDIEAEGPIEEIAIEEPAAMEVQVRRLRETMALLQPIVPKKPAIKALSNILLKDGQVIATNLETAAMVALPEVDGQCLLPFYSVLDLVKYIPGNDMLTIERSGRELNLSWPEGKASYEAENTSEYPLWSEPELKVEENVDGDTLIPVLLSMIGYCATETDRAVLTGVSVFLGDSIEIASGDGFRMAHQALPIAIPPGDDLNTVIIPVNSIRVLNHLWTKGPRTTQDVDSLVELVSSRGKLQLGFGDNGLMARFGSIRMVSRLISGTPPNFVQLIPPKPPLEVQLYAPDLERAARRVRKVAKDGKGIVRLVWEDGSMKVSAKAEGEGEVQATIPVVIQGEPGKVGLDIKYLLEYLKGKTGLVTMGITSETSPIVFHYRASPLVLIMPMMIEQ